MHQFRKTQVLGLGLKRVSNKMRCLGKSQWGDDRLEKRFTSECFLNVASSMQRQETMRWQPGGPSASCSETGKDI